MALAAFTAAFGPSTIAVRAQESPRSQGGSRVRVVNGKPLEMKLVRYPGRVEVVIEGVGSSPQLRQSVKGNLWEGRLLTSGPTLLRRGPQRLSLPEAGLDSISIQGGGREYQLLVTPASGFTVTRPVVSSDGRRLILSFAAPSQESLQTLAPDLTAPARVPQPGYVPPLQPRAVAPPVGDMAVGSMLLSNPSYVNVSGPPVTMTLNNAPAKDVLMALSRMGGYGFVFVDDSSTATSSLGGGSGVLGSAALRPISITFQNEAYGRAVNSALLAAGLQGKLEGNMILAGPDVLGKTFGAQMSKVYRLNQASASSAADYLANLGATINKTFTTTSVTSDIQSAGTAQVGSATQTSATATTTQIESYGASQGPLRGLIGTTDSRLGTITLVGDPKLVAVAENYLRQLDLRQRQVALSVRVLDISLDNANEIANSFSFRWGNNLIINDQGRLVGAFGRDLPALTTPGGVPVGPFPNASLNFPRDNFLDLIAAQIDSRSVKLLANPTLILQENPSTLREGGGGGGGGGDDGGLDEYTIDSPIGRSRANEAAVRVGTNVTTNIDVTTDEAGNVSCELELSTAGLILGARVDKIDDNGFVTFSLSPSISAVTDIVPLQGASTNCGTELNILSVRRLDTGSVRVRDGQTLVLTGVISDADVSEVRKWPILGDVPIIGQFFRASSTRREKRELVIMVTPRIIDDEQGGSFGYGFQSGSAETRRFMSQP